MKYAFERIQPTGELIAVWYEDDWTVIGVCRPLQVEQVRTENLPNFAYDRLSGASMRAQDELGFSDKYPRKRLSAQQVAAIQAQYEDESE